jgi:transcription initiation factor TFIID TATA-box-binding protein
MADSGSMVLSVEGYDDNPPPSFMSDTVNSTSQQQDASTNAPPNTDKIIEVSLTAAGNDPVTLNIRIHNMSATINLGHSLDLSKIARQLRNTAYNPRRHRALLLRLKDPPKATVLLFASGKCALTQVTSWDNAQLAVRNLAQLLHRLGYPLRSSSHKTDVSEAVDYDLKIQNMAGIVHVGCSIYLEGLLYAHSAFTTYEPELFPGLLYRLVNPRVVCMIFASGTVVLTGTRKESDLSAALQKIYPILMDFRNKGFSLKGGERGGRSSGSGAASHATDLT